MEKGILITAGAASPNTDNHRKPWPHKVGFHCEKGWPDQTGSLFETQSELNYGDSQHAFVSRKPESLFCMCFYHHYTLHRENKRLRQERSPPKKRSKFPTDLWPGGPRGCPRMHTEEVQTEFMTELSPPFPHHLSTHQWTLEATTLKQTDRASLIHSPPRCLCQVIAGGKRKTDQYISHGPDR